MSMLSVRGRTVLCLLSGTRSCGARARWCSGLGDFRVCSLQRACTHLSYRTAVCAECMLEHLNSPELLEDLRASAAV